MLDSMFDLARSSRVCDIADRKKIFTSSSLLKNLSADATAAGIVKNIHDNRLQTFGNNSHKPHGSQGGDHYFNALLKYCKWLVSPVCFEIFRFLGMSANPKLTFISTLYQLATQV